MTTFRDRNRGMRHMVFDEMSAERLIAERLGAREAAAFRACAVPAMQADYFRYCAGLVLGGVYADASLRCLRPLDSLLRPDDEAVLFRREPPPQQLSNGFFVFAAPGHPLLRLSVDVATMNIERRAADKIHMVTGPWVFHSLLVLHRLGSFEAAAQRVAEMNIDALAESVKIAVGNYGRVREAFRRVRIAPLDEAMRWIARAEETPRYKLDGGHWTDWHREGRSIFR